MKEPPGKGLDHALPLAANLFIKFWRHYMVWRLTLALLNARDIFSIRSGSAPSGLASIEVVDR